MTTEHSDALPDSWQGTELLYLLEPPAEDLHRMLELRLGHRARAVGAGSVRTGVVVIADCRRSMGALAAVRKRWAQQPLVALVADLDPALVIEALAAGADGVLAAAEANAHWLECLHVVRGGGRWVGGPAMGVDLEGKYARYGVSPRTGRAADVTMRTTLFVKGRLADRIRS